MNLNFLAHEPILILTIDCMNSLLEFWSHFMHLRHELPEKHSKEVVVHLFLKLPQHKLLGLEVGQHLFCSFFMWRFSFPFRGDHCFVIVKICKRKGFLLFEFSLFPENGLLLLAECWAKLISLTFQNGDLIVDRV